MASNNTDLQGCRATDIMKGELTEKLGRFIEV